MKTTDTGVKLARPFFSAVVLSAVLIFGGVSLVASVIQDPTQSERDEARVLMDNLEETFSKDDLLKESPRYYYSVKHGRVQVEMVSLSPEQEAQVLKLIASAKQKTRFKKVVLKFGSFSEEHKQIAGGYTATRVVFKPQRTHLIK
jgi:hypothetical protein